MRADFGEFDWDLRYLNAKLDHRAENDLIESFGCCLFLISINSVGFAPFSPVTDLFNIVIYLALVVNGLFV